MELSLKKTDNEKLFQNFSHEAYKLSDDEEESDQYLDDFEETMGSQKQEEVPDKKEATDELLEPSVQDNKHDLDLDDDFERDDLDDSSDSLQASPEPIKVEPVLIAA